MERLDIHRGAVVLLGVLTVALPLGANGGQVDLLDAGWRRIPVATTERAELSGDGSRLAWTYRSERGPLSAGIYDVAKDRRLDVPLGRGERAYVTGWSPDSSRAWVVLKAEGVVKVFTVSATDGELLQECELLGARRVAAVVSPCGDALCIVSELADGKGAVTVLDRDRQERRSTELSRRVMFWAGVAWSPVGDKVVLPVGTGDRFRWQLMVLQISDLEEQLLPDGIGPTFAWSHDSSHILSWRAAQGGLELVAVSVESGRVDRVWRQPSVRFPSLIDVQGKSGLAAVAPLGDGTRPVFICFPDGRFRELPELRLPAGNVAFVSPEGWLLVACRSPVGEPDEPGSKWVGPGRQRLMLVHWPSGETVELPVDVSFWSVSADGTSLLVGPYPAAGKDEGLLLFDLRCYLETKNRKAPGALELER